MRLKLVTSALLLSLTSVSGFSSVQKQNIQVNDTLEIVSLPYVTNISLGDDLYTEGLIVKDGDTLIPLEDLVFQGHDPSNLGEQTITILHDNKYASFDIYVTNEFVYNDIPLGNLFISEFVYLSEDNIAIELYNNTRSFNIDLSSYKIELKNNNESLIIPLGENEIISKQTFVVASFNIENIAYLQTDINLSNLAEVRLLKENTVVDELLYNHFDSFPKTIRRHYKVHKTSSSFNEREWVITNGDISDLGNHTILKTSINHIEEARAYARYVLFGAGMFASGRVNEAFEALKKEYNLMSSAAKEYFNNNKNEKVEGYNESGKLVSMSFSVAHLRIGLLAARSGNESFLTKKSSCIFQNNNVLFIIVAGIIVILMGVFYFIAEKIRKKNECF